MTSNLFWVYRTIWNSPLITSCCFLPHPCSAGVVPVTLPTRKNAATFAVLQLITTSRRGMALTNQTHPSAQSHIQHPVHEIIIAAILFQSYKNLPHGIINRLCSVLASDNLHNSWKYYSNQPYWITFHHLTSFPNNTLPPTQSQVCSKNSPK